MGTGQDSTAEGAAAPQQGPGAWELVRSPVIGMVAERAIRVDVLAAHRARGVALIDIAPARTPRAVATFRCRLELAEFAEPHPGTLPVAYCRLDAAELPRLPRLLDEALPVQPALLGTGNWVPGLAALVRPAPGATTAPRWRRWLLVAGAAALALLGVVLVLILA